MSDVLTKDESDDVVFLRAGFVPTEAARMRLLAIIDRLARELEVARAELAESVPVKRIESQANALRDLAGAPGLTPNGPAWSRLTFAAGELEAKLKGE